MPTVLITGANRGIGLEFAKIFASSGYKTIAAVRTPSSMPKIEGVITVKLDAGSTTGAHTAVKELQSQGINSLDIVIANAAVSLVKDPFSELSIDDYEMTMNVNVRGQMLLFQATLPLLPKDGKFCFISSAAGTIEKEMKPGQGSYEMSKAALNFMMRKLHFEHPDLLIFAFSPGWLRTAMGNQGAKWSGMDEAPEDINETVPAMVKLLEEGDKKKLGGWMISWNGSRLAF